MDIVAKSAPDGQTIMITTNTTLTLPYFYKKIAFDVLHSFQPLCMVGSNNFALVVHPTVPAGTVKELIAYVSSQHGEMNYASPGNGTLHHLAMEKILQTTGMRINHVPYKGTAGAMNDVIGGHVKMMILPIHLAVGLQKAGKVKVIGSTRAQRDPLFPNVMPLQEGGVANFNEDAFIAIWAPKGMAPTMVALYNSAIRESLEGAEIEATMAQQGVTLSPGSPEELMRTAVAEHEKWGRVIRSAKIEPE
jgi:tripartite-type tricarboxylate transporter receptor subunit TctC